ncbi:MAG: hypothetical protein Q8N01_06010 [Sulfuricurvum sp.]|nr:hypothetical protein [Sulfuricurvum sp.]
MFNFLNWFYRPSIENKINADLSYNAFLDGHEIGVNPENDLFDPSSLDELSYILDCERNQNFFEDEQNEV